MTELGDLYVANPSHFDVKSVPQQQQRLGGFLKRQKRVESDDFQDLLIANDPSSLFLNQERRNSLTNLAEEMSIGQEKFNIDEDIAGAITPVDSGSAQFESSMAGKTLNESGDSFGTLNNNNDESEDFFMVRKRKHRQDTMSNSSFYNHSLFFPLAAVFCILGLVSQGGFLQEPSLVYTATPTTLGPSYHNGAKLSTVVVENEQASATI